MLMSATISRMTRLRRDRSGAAAAEFALVMPFLFLVFFGIVKFGIALNHNLALTDATRASARQLAVGRSSGKTRADALAQLYASAATLAAGTITVTTSVNGAVCVDDTDCASKMGSAPGASATVRASVPCDLSIMGRDFAPGCKISSQTTERVE